MNEETSKKHLQVELKELRQRVADLEAQESKLSRAEDELKQNKEYLENLNNSLPDAIITVDVPVNIDDRIIRYANKSIEKIFGYKQKELLGKSPVVQYASKEDFINSGKVLKSAISRRTKVIHREELLLKRKNGETFPAELTTTFIRTGGKVTQITSIIRDITERRQAEEALHLRAHLLNEATDSIIATDLDGNLIYMNEATCRTYGYSKEQLLNMNLRQLVSPDITRLVDEKLRRVKEEGAITFESEHRHRDGSVFPVEVTARTVNLGDRTIILSAIRDITERKKMEEQLIVTDRLASIGELASGVAHELNNPLTGIIGFSELLLNKDVPEDVKGDLKIIHREAQRTAQVVKNLLTFARKQDTTKKPADINKAIKSVLDLRAYDQKVHNIDVVTDFAPDLPEFKADIFRLQQVFVNIIINAEYFILQAHGKGTITITTKVKGDTVLASFADDGPGIKEEHLRRLFDPFFTTKEVGQGTGLGLSICHGIVTEHGGHIYAESEPGQGATFIVELPIR
ncbi:MAG: PAS domain S-box protein [Chloroflexota bacterium]|nr:PAS domain S-box protein [Chloroflexota bacterium]